MGIEQQQSPDGREAWEVHRDNYNTHHIVPTEFEFCTNCGAVETELLFNSCEVFRALAPMRLFVEGVE